MPPYRKFILVCSSQEEASQKSKEFCIGYAVFYAAKVDILVLGATHGGGLRGGSNIHSVWAVVAKTDDPKEVSYFCSNETWIEVD